MKKEQVAITYEITFHLSSGKALKTVRRKVRGVLNNGVIKKVAKEEGGINYSYWVSKKVE